MVKLSRFFNKDVEIWSKGFSIHLGGGLFEPGEPVFSYHDRVNIQPFSSAEAYKDYGFDLVTTHAMYTKIDEISVGNDIVKYNNHDYKVKEKISWDNYTEVLLERL